MPSTSASCCVVGGWLSVLLTAALEACALSPVLGPAPASCDAHAVSSRGLRLAVGALAVAGRREDGAMAAAVVTAGVVPSGIGGTDRSLHRRGKGLVACISTHVWKRQLQASTWHDTAMASTHGIPRRPATVWLLYFGRRACTWELLCHNPLTRPHNTVSTARVCPRQGPWERPQPR